MVGFQHVATITQGYVGNISDLTLGQVGGQVVLVGATYAGGGVSIWGGRRRAAAAAAGRL